MRIEALELACWLLLGSAAILGGLSFFSWRDAALALLAVPVLLSAAWPRPERPMPTSLRRLVALALVLALLPLVYLLPLPLELAAQLPGRAARLQATLAELGPQRWTSLSLAADDTWQAWLKLIPGLAVFLALLRLSGTQQRRLLGVILVIVLLQALWGLAQLSADADSVLRFYAPDGDHRASGGFSNRNHFASLLLLALPLTAVLASSGSWSRQRPPQAGWHVLGVLGLLLLMAALLASRSRAAVGLLLIETVLFCVWLLRHRRVSPGLLVGGTALSLGLAAMLLLASPHLLGGVELGSADGRLDLARRSLTAALAFFPLGAGPGTFGSVFASFDTLDTLDKVYINHAHNDLLELLFELGAIGGVLYLAAMALIATALWRHLAQRGSDAVQWACVLGLSALLLHGWVDYPTRAPLVALVALTYLGVMLKPASLPRHRSDQAPLPPARPPRRMPAGYERSCA